ncbi:MAG: leucine-rich repeat protein [Parabacteroides sp.]
MEPKLSVIAQTCKKPSPSLKSCTSIGDYAFYNCSSMQGTITIPGSCTIGDWAFSTCTSITGLVISEGCEAISTNAFLGCTSLANVTFPESLKSIGEGAFMSCSRFSQINIPKNVETIGNGAFYTNGLIQTITVHSETPPAGEYPFHEGSLHPDYTTLHFEDEALAKNYTTGQWGLIQPYYDATPHTQDGMTFTLPGSLPENPEESPEATLSSYSGTETTLEIPGQIRSHGYEFAVTAVNAQVLSGKTEIKMESEAPLRIEGEGFTGSNAVKVYYPLGARDVYEDSPWKECDLRPYDFETSAEAPLATVAVGGEVVGSVIVKVGGEEKGTVSHGDENAHAYDVNGDIVISPAEGYEIASITVMDSDRQEVRWEINGDDRVISNVTTDITVQVTLAKMMLITVSPVSNGKIYANDNDVTGTSFYVKYNTERTFKAVAKEEADRAYVFKQMQIGETAYPEAEKTVSLTSDTEVTAEFSLDWVIVSQQEVAMKYQNTSSTDDDKTVKFVNNSYTAATALEIPSTVTCDEISYAVTEIEADAFEGCDALTKVHMHHSERIPSPTGPYYPLLKTHTTLYVPEGKVSDYAAWGEVFKEIRCFNSAGKDEMRITVMNDGNGRVCVEGTEWTGVHSVFEGDHVTLTMEGNGNYALKKLSIGTTADNLSEVTPTGNAYTIEEISSDMYVKAEFGIPNRTITLTPPSCGSIEVYKGNERLVPTDNRIVVENGTEITIQAVPDSDYGFSWLKINGVKQSGATVTVTADSDMTVEASFYYIIPSVFMYDDVCYEKRWDASYWEEVTVTNLDYFYYDKYYTGDLELPEQVAYYGSDYWVTAINERAFSGCRGLRSVVLPSTVDRIGSYAFEGCTGLEKLVVKSPSSVLRAATARPAVPTAGNHAFDDIIDRATLYVPEGRKEDFKAAPEWCKFYSIKEMRTDGTVLAELTMTATDGGTLAVGEITSENGTQIVKVAEGTDVTVKVTAREGYVLTGLSYDGEDVTGQLVNDKLTLKGLNGENSLTAKFSVSTGIESVQGTTKNIFVKAGRIIVEGVPEGEQIRIFDVSGRLLRSEVSNGGSVEIPMATGPIYIVRIGNQTVKLANY